MDNSQASIQVEEQELEVIDDGVESIEVVDEIEDKKSGESIMEEELIEDENDSLNNINKMSVGDEVEIELSQENKAKEAYGDDKECGEDIYKSEYYSLNYEENKDKSSQ